MSMRLHGIAASIIGLAASSVSILVVGGAAASPTLTFDDNWSLTASGQLRPRAIVHTGRDFLPDSEIEEVVTQRAALGLRLSQKGGPAFVLRIQDVRIWGEENNTLNDYSAEGLDAREAYVSLPVADGLTLRAGEPSSRRSEARAEAVVEAEPAKNEGPASGFFRHTAADRSCRVAAERPLLRWGPADLRR